MAVKVKTTAEERAGSILALFGLLGLPALIGFIIYMKNKKKPETF